MVRAEIVDIAPWMPGSFAVHRNPFFGQCGLRWRVSNIETGAWCGEGNTRTQAIEHAKERARKYDRRGYWKQVKRICKEYPQVLDTTVEAWW